MNLSKPLLLRGRAIADGRTPLLCAPLVGHDEATLLAELEHVLVLKPDLIEWRIDFFSGIADTARVMALGLQIRTRASGIPLIFTRRSIREGGEPIPLAEASVQKLYEAAIEANIADFYDCELSCDAEHFAAIRGATQAAGAQLLASFHNFQETPSAETLAAKFQAMASAGADIVKIAVMPRSLDDVLNLLQATRIAHQTLTQPVISMSMGPYGALSRMFGWAFGSSVSFAVGARASAPGQIPLTELREIIEAVQRHVPQADMET